MCHLHWCYTFYAGITLELHCSQPIRVMYITETLSYLPYLVKLSEDCLFLNVFVPSAVKLDAKLAVMVWIHGGGFIMSSSTNFPGGILTTFNDVIIVTINYRLGVLGFFNIPGTDYKGNYGMMDQVQNLIAT